jgi:HSP20 family protein
MSNIKWQPLSNPLHQIDRSLNSVTYQEPWLSVFSEVQQTPWMPAIELRETETNLLLRAHVPGLQPEKLDIQLSKNTVLLTGEYLEEDQDHLHEIIRSDFHYGQFRRIVPLPSDIYWQSATVDIVNGLLILVMPKVLQAVT